MVKYQSSHVVSMVYVLHSFIEQERKNAGLTDEQTDERSDNVTS